MTFKLKAKGIAIYSRQIAVIKLSDRDEASRVPEELKDLTNTTYEDRENIQPCHRKGGELKYLDVFKLLLRTNCKECGQPTCLAFAVALLKGQKRLQDCSALTKPEFAQDKEALATLLQTTGQV